MNSADQDAIDERQEELNVAQDNYESDLKWLLEQVQARRFFKKFFSESNIFNNTFTGNSRSYYLDGQRELTLGYFKAFTRASPGRMSELWLDIVQKEK